MLGEGGANPLRRSGSWGWDRIRLTLEQPFSVHMSAPSLSRTEGSPRWFPGYHWLKPGAHHDFLSEGPVRPRLPLLLVPTSWDMATLEPTHAQPSKQHISSCCWQDRGRLYIAWFPGFLVGPASGAPSPLPRRGCLPLFSRGFHRSPFVSPALPEASCSSCCL